LDQAALLGSKCICIKKWKFKRNGRNRIIEEMEIFTATRVTMNFLLNILDLPYDNDNVLSPKFPLFEDIDCYRLRSLIAIGISCDINLHPIVTPQNILKFMKEPFWTNVGNDDKYLELKKYYIQGFNKRSDKRTKIQYNKKTIFSDNVVNAKEFNKMVDIFVDAFVYEPTITDKTTTNGTTNFTYIHGPPNNILHPYIESFNNNNHINNIYQQQKLLPTDVDDCCICCGTGKKSHLFLEAEGFCCCFTCGKIICMQCIFNKENTDEIYCYECFMPEISVDICQVDSIMTSHQLRDEPDKMNIITTADDDRFILQEIYDAMINSSLYESVTDRISVPKENSLYLQELENNSKINSLNVSKVGHMIINELINPVQIKKLIKMMALVVKMYDKEKDGTTRNKEYMQNTYKLVPSSIVRFAEDSRIKGGGGRLVDRCLRHSTDQETPDLMEATGHVVEYQEQPRLLLNHVVRSSMKQDEYKVSVCFSEETIVSCSCDCRAGSIGTGRVLCVHVLPVIYQMTLLIFDGLADNLLITIANNWDRLSQGVDSTNMREIEDHILLLKSAATRQMNPNDDTLELDVLLEQYLVGTEKRKFGRRRLRKHKKELGPIRRLCFASCNQHAKRLMDDVE
jgi:hypothetical protein